MILGNLLYARVWILFSAQGICRRKHEFALDPDEPSHVAEMAARMKLRYVVITCVNRDDLEDGGSHHFAETVREVRRALPDALVEVLTPDFCGDLDAVARVLEAGPHVFNHNMETVPAAVPRASVRRPTIGNRSRVEFAKQHRAATFDEIRLDGGAGRIGREGA